MSSPRVFSSYLSFLAFAFYVPSFSFVVIALFFFVFILSLELCRFSSDVFPVKPTTYRPGLVTAYTAGYVIRLRHDQLIVCDTHTQYSCSTNNAAYS